MKYIMLVIKDELKYILARNNFSNDYDIICNGTSFLY